MNPLQMRMSQIEWPANIAEWLSVSTAQPHRHLPASFLAIDWTGTQLVVTEVNRQGTRNTSGRTFRQSFAPNDPDVRQRITQWLVALMQNEQLCALDAVVAAPRRFVAFKAITLPNIQDDRLADAVACQAETIFPIPAKELAIDFIARPYAPAQHERAVLVAAIPRVHLDLIEQVLSEAGLRLLAVLVSELGLGGPACEPGTQGEDLETRSLSGQAPLPNTAVISINGSKIEYLIRSQGDPILCYAAKAPERSSLVSEIGTTLHRLIASMPRSLLDGPLTHLHLIGREAPALQMELRKIPGVSLTIEATQATEEEVKLSAITAAFEDPRCRIDFQNPRRSIDPQILRKQKRLRYAAVAVLITGLCFTGGWLNSLRLQQRIASLQSEVSRLQQHADDRRATWESAAAVARWQDSRTDWSQALGSYLQQLPNNEELMLKSLELSSSPSGDATIDIEALARSGTDVHQLIDQFIASAEFCRTQLKRLELKAGDARYSAEFSLGVSLAGGTKHVQ